jgi:predicted double-glycine peptidase
MTGHKAAIQRSASRMLATIKGTLLAFICLMNSPAYSSSLEARTPQDGSYAIRVTSLKEARFATTRHQQYDFSCGSAALATLLTFHYNDPVNEQQIFAEMFARGDQAKIRHEGFSLLDMKRYLEAHNYQADGYEQPLERLAQENLPAIVLINENGYRHFVVVKGVTANRVLLGDPARGTRPMSLARFRSLWSNGILFVITNRRGDVVFNAARDWRVAPSAPMDMGLQRERFAAETRDSGGF